MHPHSQADLKIQALTSESVLIKDIDTGAPSSSSMAVDAQKPVKKQTRQWAAWTRQEEENFFNALRQVGKNFAKITCRVESKNKDQVRHYYYRLVRRMNKLLGPGFCLDAKNSKDTNAAMLRWWSLLEKYSCTASKLHLKPRRFKIFVEALEHQLLKDRNKNRRKRPSQGENYSSIPLTTASILSKAPGCDARAVKLLLDTQNPQKLGSTKGASLKRFVGANMNFNKGDLSTMKTVRQKRRTASGVASAAYKRWEKAATAGVSLVADAAAQLERTVNHRDHSADRETLDVLPNKMYTINEQNDIDSVGNNAYRPTSEAACSQQPVRDTIIQPSMKLKLQLFPVDEDTRKALEKDEHNPYLELTLRSRKRISSVLEHLNRKWGNSSIASGELVLFPYSSQLEDIPPHYQRWSIKDTVSSAADVYVTIGSPAIFRLRYGWFSSADRGSEMVQVPSTVKDIQEGSTIIGAPDDVDTPTGLAPISNISEQPPMESSKEQHASMAVNSNLLPSVIDIAESMKVGNSMESKNGLPESPGGIATSWLREEIRDGSIRKQPEDAVDLGMSICATLSAGEWADSLTNISVGDLLSEASKAADSNCIQPSTGELATGLQEIPFSSDSFDAAIAAHIYGHQLSSRSTQVSHASIWDAEETCDGFSFRMIPDPNRESNPLSSSSTEDCRQSKHTSSMGFRSYLKDFTETRPLYDPACEDLKADSQSAKELTSNSVKGDPAKDLGLTDIYWSDSLGPLDLDIPSSRYQGQDLILGESISLGLSRLIASSLDAFQQCSFFGTDKKDSSASETRVASLLLDSKIGSED